MSEFIEEDIVNEHHIRSIIHCESKRRKGVTGNEFIRKVNSGDLEWCEGSEDLVSLVRLLPKAHE